MTSELARRITFADTPEGRELAKAEISRHGTPLYGYDPARAALLQQLPDGTRRFGRFVNRRFVSLSNQQEPP